MEEIIKNEDERLVRSILSTKNTKVQYEPNGNATPDFLVNNSIAIEVTRLNQKKIKPNGSVVDLDSEWHKVFHAVNSLLDQIVGTKKVSHFIFMNFKGPIRRIKSLINALKLKLDELKNEEFDEKLFEIEDTFELRLSKSENAQSRRFEIGSINNIDKGGFVEEMVVSNINRILKEKSYKIKDVKNMYEKWHLILVDYIDYCRLSESELISVKSQLIKDHLFDKILMVNHLNKSNVIELN